MEATSAHAMALAGIEVDLPIPRQMESKFGPAMCRSAEEIEACAAILHSTLRLHPHAIVGVDLEGELGGPHSHVSLIQIAIKAQRDTEVDKIYVINSHKNTPFIRKGGPESLKAILEDPRYIKVFHHCRGDGGGSCCRSDLQRNVRWL